MFQTKTGIWLPPTASFDTKADRSQASSMRGGMSSMSWQVESKFKTYTQYLNAIKIPWVYPSISLISYTFANNRWSYMQGDTTIETTSDPFLQLMARPNPVQSGFHFKELYSFFMELLGEAFISLENRRPDGTPRELYLLNPANMTVIPDPQTFVKGYLYRDGNTGRSIPYDADEIIHIKMPNPLNPYRGFGPVEASAIILDIVSSMATFEQSYYRSGGRIVGVLETDTEVSDEDFEKIKRDWKAFSSDDQQRLKTAILQNGLKYTPIAEGMKNINLVDINKEKRDAILSNWRIPKAKVGILEDAQYKLNDADQTFQSETMEPKFTRWEFDIQPLIDLFNPNRRWEFERKSYEDDTTKLNNTKTMMESLAFTLNDMLAYNGMEPVSGGDVIFLPGTLSPYHLGDLSELADSSLELATAPPEPPPTPGAQSGGNLDAPNPGTGGQGSDNIVHLADHMKLSNLEGKSVEERLKMAGIDERAIPALTMEEKATILADQKVQAIVEGRISVDKQRYQKMTPMERMQRRTKKVAHTSTHAPAVVTMMRRKTDQFINTATIQGTPTVRRYFRGQQRAMLRRIPEILRGVSYDHDKPDNTKIELRNRIGSVIRHPQRLQEAVGGILASGINAGYRTGQALLSPQQAAVFRARRQAAPKSAVVEGKELPNYLGPDSPDWRQFVETWRNDNPGLEQTFSTLAERVTRVDDTTITKLADVIAEGLRRGYSVMQITNGNDQEEYGGIQSVWDDASDWRAEMVARTEGRDAFIGGAFRSFADGDVSRVEAIDGTLFDEDCRARNGEIFPFDPVGGDLLNASDGAEHPNGTLTFAPLPDQSPSYFSGLEARYEQKAPDVHVDVHLGDTTFNATLPELKQAAAPEVKIENILPEQKEPNVKVDVYVPEQKSPDVHVENHMPELKQPDVKVDVHVPQQKAPDVKVDVKAPPPANVHVDFHAPEAKAAPDEFIELKATEDEKGNITIEKKTIRGKKK